MSRDRADRPTIMRGVIGGGGAQAGGRDDKTRVRMPAVRPGESPGSGGESDTRHVDRVPSSGGRSAARHTVRVQVLPKHFGWLVAKTGTRVGQVYPLNPDVTDLGRGGRNDIVVDDDRVSEQHARVRVDDQGRFVVWDLASTNGTYVNGTQITAATPIVENDEVRVGQTEFVLKTLNLEA